MKTITFEDEIYEISWEDEYMLRAIVKNKVVDMDDLSKKHGCNPTDETLIFREHEFTCSILSNEWKDTYPDFVVEFAKNNPNADFLIWDDDGKAAQAVALLDSLDKEI